MQTNQLKIMTIGAHPDDCELGSGGVCLKYAALGHKVKYVYTTNGDAGHQTLGGRELAAIRACEVKNACAAGNFEYEIMDNHDGYLEASIANRDNLIRIIREFKPDIIFTHRFNDYHTDHRNTSLLVQNTAYLLMVPNICPDAPALKYNPIIMYLSDNFVKPVPFEPTVIVGIDDVFKAKLKMLECHKSQVYEWLPWIDGYLDTVPSDENEKMEWLAGKDIKFDSELAIKYRSLLKARYGNEKGSEFKYAEAFELSEYGGRMASDMIPVYFPF